MNAHQFAIAIVCPGGSSSDVVNAAMKYNVHIIDKETYLADKDYRAVVSNYHVTDYKIELLFVFPDGEHILAVDNEQYETAISKINTRINATTALN